MFDDFDVLPTVDCRRVSVDRISSAYNQKSGTDAAAWNAMSELSSTL